MLDQVRQKGLRYKKGIYANRTDIHGNPNIELVRYSLRKWKEKEDCEETDKDRTRTGIVQIAKGLSSYTRLGTSYLAPHPSGGQPTPPPTTTPRHHLPTPFSTSTHASRTPSVNTHAATSRPTCSRGPFSMRRPCESHVVRTPAVIPRPPCLSTRCHSTRQPTPRSAVDLMLLL